MQVEKERERLRLEEDIARVRLEAQDEKKKVDLDREKQEEQHEAWAEAQAKKAADRLLRTYSGCSCMLAYLAPAFLSLTVYPPVLVILCEFCRSRPAARAFNQALRGHHCGAGKEEGRGNHEPFA
jgi:hypothetical protein